MKNLWIEIKVEIRDAEHFYNSTRGEAETTIVFPEELLDSLELIEIVRLLKKSAYVDYKNNLKPENDGE